MRQLQRLNNLVINRAKTPGYIHDGSGLYLQVSGISAIETDLAS
jgi:hypothetical protein